MTARDADLIVREYGVHRLSSHQYAVPALLWKASQLALQSCLSAWLLG
jgi:hypothetical protein